MLKPIDPEYTEQLLSEVSDEVARQDQAHPVGYPATRDGVFLGIKTAVHELDVEAIDAWAQEKRTENWAETRGEVLQAIGVAVRLLRSIDTAAAGDDL